ncbi:hypothetical protein [Amycolatopsis sp. WAC 04197]|uniref:hypothetical protein n=1 Tax=Amycolatopsis sp. WAC 04197 TaxID=2203199 RepID=UPI000F7A41ED|nr:hypothetical protein [Amycolatopsis sp. WAC 04197]
MSGVDRNHDGKVDIFFAPTRQELANLKAAGTDFETEWAKCRKAIEDITPLLGFGKLGEAFQDCADNTPDLIKSANGVDDNFVNLADNAEKGVKVYESAQTEATDQLGS